MDLKPGALIAERYRVERVLLAKESGTLLAARTLRDGLVVAVKVFPSSASAAQLISRFARAQKIESPYAPKLVELGGLDDARTFIAMEYVEGETLKTIAARGPLPISGAVGDVLQACHAVAAAHEAGVVHRRLKTPKLIKTRTKTGGSEIKVLGFATSFVTTDPKNGDSPDGVDYLAPEQLTSVKNGERSADVWALGVILYELLTGRLPFTALTRKALAKHVRDDEPKRPRSIRGELPWQLEQVLLRCLEKAPASRFESVGALATALEPFASPASTGRTVASMSPPGASATGPSELPDVTKLHHLQPGGPESSAERTPAFHRLRSDGQLEGLKVDSVAGMARARRVEGEAVRLKQESRRPGGVSL
ncbi:MAG TPA: serine/threonine-protein kinase, partial [Labilithrix sp.]|nr:serine/threonine-protein kinase [Labilithrix sp.]